MKRVVFIFLGIVFHTAPGMIKEGDEQEQIMVFFGEVPYLIPYDEAMQSETLKNQYTESKKDFKGILYAREYTPWVVEKILALLKVLSKCSNDLKGKSLLDFLDEAVEIKESWTISKWWNNRLHKDTVDLFKALDYLHVQPAITFLMCKLVKTINKAEEIEELIKTEPACLNFQYEFARYYRLVTGNYFPYVDRNKYSFTLQELHDWQPQLLFEYIHVGEPVRSLSNLLLSDAQEFEKLPNSHRVSHVLLDNNYITSLENTFFKSEWVGKLNVNCNRIQIVKNTDFIGIQNLKELILGNNYIKRLEAKAFEPLKQLHLLDLSNNGMEHIDVHAFDGLEYLNFLYLNRNKIATLQPGTFASTAKLRSLELSNNELSNFNTELVNKLPYLKLLYLGSNGISADKQREIVRALELKGIIFDFI
jgi:hypothetical protein